MFRSRRFRASRPEHREESRPAREPRRPRSQTPRITAPSLILLGLIIGLIGGLSYAWLINPVVYVNASPARLSARYQEEYIFLVSQSYAASGDLALAQERLAALDLPNTAQAVAEQFERYLRDGRPPAYVRNLAALTQALGGESPALSLFGPTPQPPPVTPTALAVIPTTTPTLLPTPTLTRQPTATPQPTDTPAPSRTPSPTPPPVYRLLEQERVCEAGVDVHRIEVIAQDALLQPLPGVEVQVSWDGGTDRFFTGFKPGQGPGYGDFTMQPGASYQVVLVEGSPVISGLRIEPCDDGSDGGWRLTFQNLEVSLPTPTPTP